MGTYLIRQPPVSKKRVTQVTLSGLIFRISPFPCPGITQGKGTSTRI